MAYLRVGHCVPSALPVPPSHTVEEGCVMTRVLWQCHVLLLCWKLGILPKKSPQMGRCLVFGETSRQFGLHSVCPLVLAVGPSGSWGSAI